jgi:hypothetical protein
MLTVRDAIPKVRELATAEFATLRLRLLKVAARALRPGLALRRTPNPAPSASTWSRWRFPVHRCSESVLAMAQTELSNPEKAMLGTVYNNRSESPQSFRYASLASGLDIVRKALGGHQIAIAQTTDIDRTSGTVNLTTLLLHT